MAPRIFSKQKTGRISMLIFFVIAVISLYGCGSSSSSTNTVVDDDPAPSSGWRLKSITWTDADGNISGTENHYYNTNNQNVLYIDNYGDGIEYDYYTYNDQDQLVIVNELEFSDDGDYNTSNYYTYNAEGRIDLVRTDWDHNGVLDGTKDPTYNSNGNLTLLEVDYNSNGSYDETISYMYLDGRLSSIEVTERDDVNYVEKETFSYDGAGRITQVDIIEKEDDDTYEEKITFIWEDVSMNTVAPLGEDVLTPWANIYDSTGRVKTVLLDDDNDNITDLTGTVIWEKVPTEPVDISGTWNINIQDLNGSVSINRTLVITQTGSTFDLTYNGVSITGGKVSGSAFTYKMLNPDDGKTYTVNGWLTDGELWGTLSTEEGIVYRFTSEYTLSFDYASLQYRTYTTGNKYRGWLDFTKDTGAPVLASDITGITLKDEEGNSITVESTTLWVGGAPTVNGYWDNTAMEMNYYYESTYYGMVVDFPADTSLAAGEYTYEVTTSKGKVLTQTVYFAGNDVSPLVAISSMEQEWMADGSLKLSWTNPDADFDQHRLTVFDTTGRELFYLKLASGAEEIVIPKEWVDNAASGVSPTNPISWNVQTRLYDAHGNNYARGYSDNATFDWN